MKRKIQPIQYINPDSDLRKDFSTAFNSALKENIEKESRTHSNLKNFLLLELMYYKPYQGYFVKRTKSNSGMKSKRKRKCFTDECEWRYIPDVSVLDLPQVITEEDLIGKVLQDYSNAMDGKSEVSLSFDYSDLKYVIVDTVRDFYEISNTIESWGLSEDEKYTLMSKIIIWENSKGDF